MKKLLTLIFLVPISLFAGPRSATLGWTASPDPRATGYRVYQGTNSTGQFVVVGGTSGTTFTVTNLGPQEVWFSVTATNATLESEPAGPVKLDAQMQAPINLNVTGSLTITNIITITLP